MCQVSGTGRTRTLQSTGSYLYCRAVPQTLLNVRTSLFRWAVLNVYKLVWPRTGPRAGSVGHCRGWGWGRPAAAAQDVIGWLPALSGELRMLSRQSPGARLNHGHSDKQAKCQPILSFNCPSLISGYKVGIVEETQRVLLLIP